MRQVVFTILLPFVLLGGNACSEPEAPEIDFSSGSVGGGATGNSGLKQESDTPQGDVEATRGLPGFEDFVIGQGENVANDETALQLNLTPGLKLLGPSVSFRATKTIPQETMERVRFQIMLTGNPLDENLVVLYRLLPVGDLPPVVGLIPLTYLDINAENKTISFKARGLGDYQVSSSVEKIAKPLASDGIKAPSPEPRLELLGKINYANFFGIEASDTTVYLIGDTGLRVVSILDPKLPVQIGSLSNAGVFGDGRGIRLRGTTLIQTTDEGGYGAFNVTTPSMPAFRGGVGDQQGRDLVLIGATYGFAATAQGMRMFEDINNGISVGTVVTQTDGCNGLDGNLSILVVACNGAVIGFTTDTLPQMSAVSLDREFGGRGVAVDNGYAYVAGDDGLRIYDVLNPLQPRKVGTLALPGALQVAVRGNTAIVLTATGATAVNVVDRMNPKLFTPNAPLVLTNGRRVKFLSPDRALILDGTGLSVISLNINSL